MVKNTDLGPDGHEEVNTLLQIPLPKDKSIVEITDFARKRISDLLKIEPDISKIKIVSGSVGGKNIMMATYPITPNTIQAPTQTNNDKPTPINDPPKEDSKKDDGPSLGSKIVHGLAVPFVAPTKIAVGGTKKVWEKKWGIAGGAALGTFFMPGIGTIIGGIVGANKKNKSNESK